jgi:hypothetical protein
MIPTVSLFVLSLSGLIGLALVTAVTAWSWTQWLKLRRHELDLTLGGSPRRDGHELPAVANRIDLADLRERVKKLEAIAAGVDF